MDARKKCYRCLETSLAAEPGPILDIVLACRAHRDRDRCPLLAYREGDIDAYLRASCRPLLPVKEKHVSIIGWAEPKEPRRAYNVQDL